MPRKPRLEFPGAFYHVLTRGNQKQKIFLDKQDFRKYLQILAEYKARYAFLLYGYVLMPNHVHLLIETGETPLSKILQGINQRYTMYFNWKYETVGHIFQGRYKAILCDREEYLLSLIKYIHSNPVKAKLVEDLDKYPWSSHRFFLKPRPEGVADTQMVLRMFGEEWGRAVNGYRDFMGQEGISRKELEKTVDQRILGDEEFARNILERKAEVILPKKRKHDFGLDEIALAIRQLCGIDGDELTRKGRSSDSLKARSLFCRVAKEYGYKGVEIGWFLGRDPGAISKYLRKAEGWEEELKRAAEILEKGAIFNIQA